MSSADSVFSKIIAGELPAEFLHRDEHCVVIKDIHPQAPVHFLVIPRKPLVSLQSATEEDQSLLGHMQLVAAKVAEQQGIGKAFRVIMNNGAGVGQTVFHLHMHVMGGYRMREQGM